MAFPAQSAGILRQPMRLLLISDTHGRIGIIDAVTTDEKRTHPAVKNGPT